MADLKFADFTLKRAIYEARYENAYLLWDFTGRIWNAMGKVFQNINMSKVEPNMTTCFADNQYELSVKIDRAHIIDLKPKSNLKDFIEKASDFVEIISELIEIKYFNRIGFRSIYIKEFESKKAAADEMLSSNLLEFSNEKHFNIEGVIQLPKYSFIWEGKSVSARITLNAQEKNINFEPPLDTEELKPINIKKNELAFDIDYFTTGGVKSGQLNVKEWISQAHHAIKRDAQGYLGGI